MNKKDYEAVEARILQLGQRFQTADAASLRHEMQAEIPEWVGADVRITSDPHHKPRHWLDNDVVILTRHAKPLTWLIFELRDLFSPWVNASNKYGFYGTLGQAASDYIAKHQPEAVDHRPLLAAVLQAALRISGQIDKGLPPDASVVFQGKDAHGRRIRIELKDEPGDA